MKKFIPLLITLALFSNTLLAQSLDKPFSQRKMRHDLEIFKKIRLEANSGLYKYKTEREIDSIYRWAEKEINQSSTYGDFHNIICKLTDFEGSLHNDTWLPKQTKESLKKEKSGYFPYPIKWVEDKWIMNYENGDIPLGSEIVSINSIQMEKIIEQLYKYYTTDGVNTTGKRIGLNYVFSKYYRYHYGLVNTFQIEYKTPNSSISAFKTVNSIGLLDFYTHVQNRYSKPADQGFYNDWEEDEKYVYQRLEGKTSLLTINSFAIGGHADDPKHKAYVSFLDSIFYRIGLDSIQHLIVDIRNNGGGSDPNDLVTYSYLTNRNFSENKQAWISFDKVPCLRYNADSKFPYLIKLLAVGKYNRMFQDEFPTEVNGRLYEDSTSLDHIIRTPNPLAFNGNVYLLTSPRIASAGSLFAAMLAGNENTTVIGEETMGGYYGHNGHTPMTYKLPKSNLIIGFSVVNLEQDVPVKDNQLVGRGVIPDCYVTQTYADYLTQKDTVLDFALDFIETKKQIETDANEKR